MAWQIINLKRKAGEFNGRNYDNYYIEIADYASTNSALIFGPDTDILKIKAEDFATELGRNVGLLNNSKIKGVKDIEGLMISPIYNKFGTCTGFTLSLGDTEVATAK